MTDYENAPEPLVATVVVDAEGWPVEPIKLHINGTEYDVPALGRRNQTTPAVRISDALRALGYRCAGNGDRRSPGGDVRQAWIGRNGILVWPPD